jgi:phosphatidylglycerophosphate synthase
VKADDTAFTTFVVRSYSGYVARWLARFGFTPNQVTVLSVGVALVAAGLCATGTRSGYVGGAVLFHLSFALDCIDGDLARYTVHYSRLGARLDLTADRIKEYALFAGLAIGVASTDPSIWWLAAATMAVQTVRHQMHFAYEEITTGPEAAPALADQVHARLHGGRWKVWLRRAAILPQGERSALICVLVAFTTPRVVFVVLLAAGILAAGYAFLGRLMRSLGRLHRPWSKSAGHALGTLSDVGPVGWLVHHALPGRSLPAPLTTLIALAALVFSFLVIPFVGGSWLIVGVLWYALLVGFASQQPLNGWADWVLPPSFRAAEYALAITTAALIAPAALPAAFCYVAVTAFHHYDTVYRLRESGSTPPRWLVIATGGHDGRMLLLGLLAWGGGTVFHIGLITATAAVAVVFLTETVLATRAQARTAFTAADATVAVGGADGATR